MKERDSKKLPIAASIAGALLVPLAIACGKDGEVKGGKIETQVPQATATLTTSTAEVVSTPEIKCSPEIKIALQLLDGIIFEVENPDPEIARNYDPQRWGLQKSKIIEGQDPGVFGLKDVQNALENCDIEEAKSIISYSDPTEKLFLGLGSSSLLLSNLSAYDWSEPTVDWSEEEIGLYDPKRILISPEIIGRTVAQTREQAAISLIDLYHLLDSLPEGIKPNENLTPQATATSVSENGSEIKCSPEVKEAIEKLDHIIYQVEHPDTRIVDGYDPSAWGEHQSIILNGDEEGYGLADLRNALEECDIKKAESIMLQPGPVTGSGSRLLTRFTGIGASGPNGPILLEPFTIWHSEEINKHDPSGIFFKDVDPSANFILPLVHEPQVGNFIGLYYYLDSLPRGN